VLDFVRNFADRCHHAKEENLLFPAMEAGGFSPEAGPTAVMRSEHDEGRGHVRTMAESLEPAGAGDAAVLRRFAEHGRAFIELLGTHITKEDQILYTMANQVMSDANQSELLPRFGQVETTETGPGTHEKYLDVAERWGVTAVARAEACGCGH
jgi:hemerythrin-like domain-containing protein